MAENKLGGCFRVRIAAGHPKVGLQNWFRKLDMRFHIVARHHSIPIALEDQPQDFEICPPSSGVP